MLSVRRRQPRFARPPIGVRRDRLPDGQDRTYLLTHTNKTVLNDQCGLVRKVLSVGHRRPRFARPPIGFDLQRYVRSVTLRYWTHTIKAVPNDQCGSVRKVLSVRRRRPRFARLPIEVRRDRFSDFGRDGTLG